MGMVPMAITTLVQAPQWLSSTSFARIWKEGTVASGHGVNEGIRDLPLLHDLLKHPPIPAPPAPPTLSLELPEASGS